MWRDAENRKIEKEMFQGLMDGIEKIFGVHITSVEVTVEFPYRKGFYVNERTSPVRGVNIPPCKVKPKSEYVEPLRKAAEHCRNNPRTLYNSKQLIELLGLDVNPHGFAISLSSRHGEMGLLKFRKNLSPYYGFSETCGPKECYEDWCNNCEMGKGNIELKFFQEEK